MLKKHVLGGALFLSSLFILSSCGEMSSWDNPVNSYLRASDQSPVIGIGEAYKITQNTDFTTISDATPEFTIAEESKDIAVVDKESGLVEGLKSGDAKIVISLPKDKDGLYLAAVDTFTVKVRVKNGEQFAKNVGKLGAEDQILLDENAEINIADAVDLSGKKVSIIGDKEKPAKIIVKKEIIISDDFILDNVDVDASESTKPFISLAATPTTEPVNDCYFINNVIIMNAEIKDMQSYFIYSSSSTRYVIKNLMIDNCVVKLKTILDGSNQLVALFRLNNNQSGVKDFTIQNSTFYQTGVSNPQYFVQYSQGDPARWKLADEETWSFNYYNNTFYGVTTGNWANTSRTNNVKGRTIFNLKKNIWVDCGNGQTAQRILNQQQASGFKEANFLNNTYWLGTAAVDQSSYDKSGTILTTNPNFKNPANGDFTPQGDDQKSKKTGDPRWIK